MEAYAASETCAVLEAAEDRCDNYAMLSRLLRIEIDEPLLEWLVASLHPGRTGNTDFDEGYRLVRGFLDGIDDIDEGRSALAIDYCLAFVGYGSDPARADGTEGLLAAYPYESVYASNSKTLTAGLSAGVAAEYRCSGFAPNRERILADDHIACELEYLQFLTRKEIEALRAGSRSRTDAVRMQELAFIEEHPLAWIGRFEAAVGDFAETDFYRGLVRMTKGWLALDADELRCGSRERGSCGA